MEALRILALATPSHEATLTDADFGRWLELGGATVARFDPEASYCAGGLSRLENDLLAAIAAERPQLVLYPLWLEFDFRPAFLRRALKNVFSVLVVTDDEHYFDVSHRYYAQCFDLVLTTNPHAERYRVYGIDAEFIEGGFDALTYSPDPRVPKDTDISFVGAMRGKVGRADYAAALTRSGLDFKLYGAGTPGGLLSRQQMVHLYRRSRINLNFTGVSLSTPLDAHLSINRRARQIKGRNHMIALSGSFVLSEYAPGIERLFEIGSEIDVFHDEHELVEKCRFYLENEDVREKMAAKAHARALRDYDVSRYGAKLTASLASRVRRRTQRGARAPLWLDKEFQRGFAAWRFKYIVIFLFAGRLLLLLREAALLARSGSFRLHAASWFAAMGLLFASRRSRLAATLARAIRSVRRAWREHD